MSARRPLRVLIVEDEAPLAMQLEAFLTDAGHEVVGWATSSSEAMEMYQRTRPDLAFIDLHLADGNTGLDVAREIRASDHSMVVFITANVSMVPEDFAGAIGVIGKPYSLQGIGSALKYLHEGIVAPPPEGVLPRSLTLAPDYRERWSHPRQ